MAGAPINLWPRSGHSQQPPPPRRAPQGRAGLVYGSTCSRVAGICRLRPREPNSPHNLSNPDTLPCSYNCVRAAALPNNKYQLRSPWDMALPQPPPPRRPCPEPDAGGRARHACAGGAGIWLRHPRLGTARALPAPPPCPPRGARAAAGHGGDGLGESRRDKGEGGTAASVLAMPRCGDGVGGAGGPGRAGGCGGMDAECGGTSALCCASARRTHARFMGPELPPGDTISMAGEGAAGAAPTLHKGVWDGGESPGEPLHRRAPEDALAGCVSPPHPWALAPARDREVGDGSRRRSPWRGPRTHHRSAAPISREGPAQTIPIHIGSELWVRRRGQGSPGAGCEGGAARPRPPTPDCSAPGGRSHPPLSPPAVPAAPEPPWGCHCCRAKAVGGGRHLSGPPASAAPPVPLPHPDMRGARLAGGAGPLPCPPRRTGRWMPGGAGLSPLPPVGQRWRGGLLPRCPRPRRARTGSRRAPPGSAATGTRTGRAAAPPPRRRSDPRAGRGAPGAPAGGERRPRPHEGAARRPAPGVPQSRCRPPPPAHPSARSPPCRRRVLSGGAPHPARPRGHPHTPSTPPTPASRCGSRRPRPHSLRVGAVPVHGVPVAQGPRRTPAR